MRLTAGSVAALARWIGRIVPEKNQLTGSLNKSGQRAIGFSRQEGSRGQGVTGLLRINLLDELVDDVGTCDVDPALLADIPVRGRWHQHHVNRALLAFPVVTA